MNTVINALKKISLANAMWLVIILYMVGELLLLGMKFTDNPIDMTTVPWNYALGLQVFRMAPLVLVEIILYAYAAQTLRRALKDGKIDPEEVAGIVISFVVALMFTSLIAVVYLVYDGNIILDFGGLLDKPVSAETLINIVIIFITPVFFLADIFITGEEGDDKKKKKNNNNNNNNPDYVKEMLQAFGTIEALIKSNNSDLNKVNSFISGLKPEKQAKAHEYLLGTWVNAADRQRHVQELAAHWGFIPTSVVPGFDRAKIKQALV